jgi:hypothetical protein
MPQFPPASVAARWTCGNAGAHLLTALGERRAFMRYETFVQQPRTELTRVLASLGETDASEALRFLDREVTVEPTHSVCGNPLRFRAGSVPIELDDQWRRDMSRRDVLTVTLLAWPLLRMYGYTGARNGR